MTKNVVVAVIVLNMWSLATQGAPPFSITIDCGPTPAKLPALRSRLSSAPADSSSLCDCIQRAFPKGVKDGKFILQNSMDDQLPNANTKFSVSMPPPKGFIPSSRLRATAETMDSAERLENFQRGVKKMMHVVSVLGHMDQYLSDRTRIIVNKLSKVYED